MFDITDLTLEASRIKSLLDVMTEGIVNRGDINSIDKFEDVAFIVLHLVDDLSKKINAINDANVIPATQKFKI